MSYDDGNRCRKCGKYIRYRGILWCKECRAKVDLELEGKADKPFDYYFRWFRTHKQHMWGWRNK